MARAELLSLLRAAKQEPNDDAPRLVLADWLEEHGGPEDLARAEFIRAQLELARDEKAEALRRRSQSRANALLREHRTAWLGPLTAVIGKRKRPEFQRGLLHLWAEPRHVVADAGARLTDTEAIDWVERLLVSGVGQETVADLVA